MIYQQINHLKVCIIQDKFQIYKGKELKVKEKL